MNHEYIQAALIAITIAWISLLHSIAVQGSQISELFSECDDMSEVEDGT